MTANHYQELALRTINPELSPKEQLLNGLMGLCGESGEAIDIMKKHLAQKHDLDQEHLAKELGDVAWYLAIAAYFLGYDLETIMAMNIEKLQERYPVKFESDLSIHRKLNDI